MAAGPSLRLNINTIGVKASQQEMVAAFNKISQGAKKTATDVDRVSTATEKLGRTSLNPMKRMGDGIDKLGGRSKNLGFVINNISNQVGDFAVQVSMGTSAIKAMGMQAPQAAGALAMLGGPFTAIATGLGLVAALGLPALGLFMQMGGEAENLDDKLEDLKDTLDAVSDFMDFAQTPIDELTKEYGGLALTIKEASAAMAELEFKKAQRDAEDLFDILMTGRTFVDDLTSVMIDLQNAAKGGVNPFNTFSDFGDLDVDTFVALRNELQLTDEAALPVANAFKQVQDAQNEMDKSNALKNLIVELNKVSPSGKEGAEMVKAIADNAFEAAENFARMARFLGIFNAEGAAGAAKFEIIPFDDKQTRDMIQIKGGKAFDEAQNAAADERRRRRQAAEAEARRSAAEARAARNKEIAQLKQVADRYKPTITAAQDYNKTIEQLNRAVEIGAITQDQHGIATAEATRRYQIASGEAADYGAVMNTFANALENNLMSVIDGTMSVQDAFKSMASAVIKELLRVLVVQQMVNAAMGAFGYSPAVGGGYVKTDVGAYGGQAYAGNAMIVGEKGPELFIPQTGGQIVPNSGMGGDVIVQQTINVQTGVQQTVRNEIRNMLPMIAESTKGAVLDAKRRGGSYGKAFA